MSSTTASASASATTGSGHVTTLPSQFKLVGILLAIASGGLIGSSFVFKKKGLLASQEGHLGEGVAYLKSPMWWTGMIMMILGEICNFAAYSFVEAIVVTPMGALSVVICAILSHFFLKESLTTFGALGCALCIVGSIVIALNGPQEATIGQITEFQKLFLAPGFLVWGGVVILGALIIIIFFAPKYGDKSMLWYISVCSLIGGLSVSCTTGLGAAIITSIMGDNQFKHWFIYFLLIFVTITLLTEIFYLNKALALFNTALVTPTYYVLFTSATLVTSIILFQGLKAPVTSILTLVMGFLTICIGITLLQMSKVDPTTLKLDRRSTILLQATRRPTELQEKSITGFEDPGMDALRGGFGTVGSIIRARSMRKSIISGTGPTSPAVEQWRQRHPYANSGGDDTPRDSTGMWPGMQRHQLYDKPVPGRAQSTLSMGTQGSADDISLKSQPPRRGHKSIKFGDQDTRHFYPQPGTPGDVRHDSVMKTDPYAGDFGRDSYASTTDTTAGGGSSMLAGQQSTPQSQRAIRPLPNPKDPFEDPRFRTGGSGGSAAELDRGADSASEEGQGGDEEVPLTAGLHKGYPHSRHPEDDRDESFGLVDHPADSVRLVQPRHQ